MAQTQVYAVIELARREHRGESEPAVLHHFTESSLEGLGLLSQEKDDDGAVWPRLTKAGDAAVDFYGAGMRDIIVALSAASKEGDVAWDAILEDAGMGLSNNLEKETLKRCLDDLRKRLFGEEVQVSD